VKKYPLPAGLRRRLNLRRAALFWRRGQSCHGPCYPDSSVFWYWFFVAPALLLALLSLRGERKRAAYVERRLAESPSKFPPASVIVPVKGPDEGLSENLAALAALDYPDYELIVCARSAGDIPPVVLPRRAKIVLAEGADPDTGEKIQNLLAAVRAVRKGSRILAFADSDGRPSPGWLRALAAPLAEEGVGASTGRASGASCEGFGMRCPPACWAPATTPSPGAAPWPSVKTCFLKPAFPSIGKAPSATIARSPRPCTPPA
jgi:hypothetical protein